MRVRWLLVLISVLLAAPVDARVVGTGSVEIDINDAGGLTFTGSVEFDDKTYDVFGTSVNLGASVGPLTTSGQFTSFDTATGDGTFHSSTTASSLTIDMVDGVVRCRDKTGTVKSNCTVIGDLAFFAGPATLSGSFAATLPPGLTYTVDGTSVFASGVPGGIRHMSGRFTLSGFQPPGAPTAQPCEANPSICDVPDPSVKTACHPVRGCVQTSDQDGDHIFDDGDGSGVIGDAPCLPGQIVGCDDNCPLALNSQQEDFDSDGVGDACDDSDGDGLLDDWELRGVPGVALETMGADPTRKDLFVEVDWMEGYSCQVLRCQGGSNDGGVCFCTDAECGADVDNCGGSPCVNCTCPDTCGATCPTAAAICHGQDLLNGDDCTCPGSAEACFDTVHCGSAARCVRHTHNPRRAVCQGGANKGDPCVNSGQCGGAPCLSAVDLVTHAFAVAPVSNPNGTTGITLHVDTGELGGGNALPHQENIEQEADDPAFSSRWPNFDHIKACNFDFRRAPIFRYGIFGHDASECSGSVGGIARAVPSNDFMVVKGSWVDESGLPGSTVIATASVFMHEFGHDLGLGHGGPPRDDVDPNYKPNYLSIMNYVYPFGLTGRLDYSRKKLPNPGGFLQETNLDETVGIAGATVDDTVLYYCPVHNCPNDQPATACQCAATPGLSCYGQSVCSDPMDPDPVNPNGFCGCLGGKRPGITGAIDWDCDGTFEPSVQADINRGENDPFSAFALCPVGGPTKLQTLRGYQDWENLHYSPKDALDYDGAPAVGCVYQTYENYKAAPAPALPAEVCDGLDNDGNGQVDEGYDRDGDGVVDCFDDCPDLANPGQSDADRDGAGDACDPQPFPVPFAVLDVKKLKVQFKPGAGSDGFNAVGSFTLGAESDGLFPPGEPIAVALADPAGEVFDQTLTTGAFVERNGSFGFKGARKARGLVAMKLKPDKRGVPGRSFKFSLKAKSVDMLGLRSSPVTLRVLVGDDVGAATLPCSVDPKGKHFTCRG